MNKMQLLQIEPTTRCNFNCIFCAGRHMEQGDMDFDDYKQIIDSFQDLKFIQLQGEGEPFLHSKIFDMIKYSKSKDIIIQTTTNGSLFSPENVSNIIDSGLDIVNISIDSPNESDFKRIRGGSFEKIVEGIKLLVEERNKRNSRFPLIGIWVTILKDSARVLPDIFNLYTNLGLDGGISIQPLNNSYFNAQYYDDELSKQHLTKRENLIILNDFYDMIKSIKIDNFIKDLNEYFYKELQSKEIKIKKSCMWLKYGLFFNIYGYATGCCAIKDYRKYNFGKVGENSIQSILLERDKFREMLVSGNISEACINCTFPKCY